MKKLLSVLGLFFLALPAAAQTTQVTGQVLDANGVPYAGASMKVGLVFAGTPVSNPTVTISTLSQCKANGFGSAPCQVPFSPTNGPFTLDASGNIPGGGITLQDNSLVTPAATQWTFTVSTPGNPPPLGTGPQTCTATVSIAGALQSVSVNFAACPALGNTAAGVIQSLPFGLDTGTAGAFVVNPIPAVTLTAGQAFSFKASHTNVAVATMNASGTGAVLMMPPAVGGGFLTGGEIVSGNTYIVFYDGTTWTLVGSSQGSPALTTAYETPANFGAINLYPRNNTAMSGLNLYSPPGANTRNMANWYCRGCAPNGGGQFNGSIFSIGFDTDGFAIFQGAPLALFNPTTYFSSSFIFTNSAGNQNFPEIRMEPGAGASGTGLTFASANTTLVTSLFTMDGATGRIGSVPWTGVSSFTSGDCVSIASPAVCVAMWHGSVAVPAASATLVVNTTALLAGSELFLQEDASLGTKLSVTCNVTPTVQPLTVTARTPGTSFTFSNTAPAANPRCVHFFIVGP